VLKIDRPWERDVVVLADDPVIAAMLLLDDDERDREKFRDAICEYLLPRAIIAAARKGSIARVMRRHVRDGLADAEWRRFRRAFVRVSVDAEVPATTRAIGRAGVQLADAPVPARGEALDAFEEICNR
jgi:hypothetical protein